jgi:SAM-dependent methyltransferase
VDQKHWDNFYKRHGKEKGIEVCSTFAQFCQKNFFNKNEFNIVEIGSGNGRDAIYFAKCKHNVIAIDQSSVALEIEKEALDNKIKNSFRPINSDFICEDYSKYQPIDVFYSRFTIHAITKEEEEIILLKIYESLKKGGVFCVEVRTIKDPLYKVGKRCDDNTYLTDHKRRFIDSEKFLKQTLSLGFKLLYFNEKNNLSVYKEDNPVLMRIILRK